MTVKRRLTLEDRPGIAGIRDRSGRVGADALGHLIGLWLTGALTATVVALVVVSHYGLETVTETLIAGETSANAAATHRTDPAPTDPGPAGPPPADPARAAVHATRPVTDPFALAMIPREATAPPTPGGPTLASAADSRRPIAGQPAAATPSPADVVPAAALDELRRKLVQRRLEADRLAQQQPVPPGDEPLMRPGKADRASGQPKRPVM